MSAWGDKRDWPDVPDRHLTALRTEAEWQVTSLLCHAARRLDASGTVAVELDRFEQKAQARARALVGAASTPGGGGARRDLVEWARRGDRWPDERWWWTPCGLVAVAWADDGHWSHRSKGQVPGWVPAATVARWARVSDRTVRRWGDNRKRVRQRGSVDDDKRRLYHRGDVAKLIVMRYVNLG